MSQEDVAALAQLFESLGARDPESWARSQVEEGIPQLARFLFLRQAWRRVVAEESSWVHSDITAAQREPDAPFAGAGLALDRLRRLGATDADLTELVRAKQAELLFSLCYLLDDPSLEEAAVADVAWALVQIDAEGNVIGGISALHESVLETDPTGREMRPRSDT